MKVGFRAVKSGSLDRDSYHAQVPDQQRAGVVVGYVPLSVRW
jgi:hypothetical protein